MFADCFKGFAVFMKQAFLAGAWYTNGNLKHVVSLLCCKECYEDAVSPFVVLFGLPFGERAARPVFSSSFNFFF